MDNFNSRNDGTRNKIQIQVIFKRVFVLCFMFYIMCFMFYKFCVIIYLMKLEDLKSQSFWESVAAITIAGVFVVGGIFALYNIGKSGMVKSVGNKISANIQNGIKKQEQKKKDGALDKKKTELLKSPVYAGPFLGDESAPLEIEGFFDLTNPYTKIFFTNAILKNTKNAIIKSKRAKLVFRNFFDAEKDLVRSEELAEAVNCAGEQGRFWQMLEQMLDNQESVKTSDLKISQYANDVNLNMDLFNYCIENKKYSDLIMQDTVRAEQIGIKTTPTFVINGKIMREGLPDQKEVEGWIENN